MMAQKTLSLDKCPHLYEAATLFIVGQSPMRERQRIPRCGYTSSQAGGDRATYRDVDGRASKMLNGLITYANGYLTYCLVA